MTAFSSMIMRSFSAANISISKYAGEHPLKIEFYRDKVPMFERFNIEREIDRAAAPQDLAAIRRLSLLRPDGGHVHDRRQLGTIAISDDGRCGRVFGPDQSGGRRRDRPPAQAPQYRRPHHLRLHRHALREKISAASWSASKKR